MLPEVVQGAYGPWQATSLIVLPFLVSLLIVLVSATIIGLPVAALLRRLGWENQNAYSVIGAAAGAIIPLLLLALTQVSHGHWLGLLGAISGGVTGYAWGRPARRIEIGPSNRRLTPPAPPL
ncbi:MAG: hypothetical protein DI552_07910 [Brevundimonas sp.]|nr:MAG: hypothetical protein DI552_07910 [Brevundimonas sp.]